MIVQLRPLNCCIIFALAGYCAPAAKTYRATGMVLQSDKNHASLTVSGDNIPGYMEAMVMSYQVRDSKPLVELKPGTSIAFTLIVEESSSYIRDIQIRKFDSAARDPVQVRTLRLLESAAGKKDETAITVGQEVPDFTLTDQSRQSITLSSFRGKLVALTFIYTRCPLPDYCFRLSNNFRRLQKRFSGEMGKELVLLSVSFDPENDQPEVLKKYAGIWKADLAGWHFLTGPLDAVKHVCGLFGMNFWPDEGLLTHALHTIVIDQQGKLAVNIEGNQFSAEQLGDLIENLLRKGQ